MLLFAQFALNLWNMFSTMFLCTLAQIELHLQQVYYIFIIESHITSFGHLRWLRSIDYEFASIDAKSKSKSKSKSESELKSISKANPIGRQFDGMLSFSFSFSTFHFPLSTLFSPAIQIPVHIMKPALLSFSICRLNCTSHGEWVEGGGTNLNTHWLCFISNIFAITF